MPPTHHAWSGSHWCQSVNHPQPDAPGRRTRERDRVLANLDSDEAAERVEVRPAELTDMSRRCPLCRRMPRVDYVCESDGDGFCVLGCELVVRDGVGECQECAHGGQDKGCVAFATWTSTCSGRRRLEGDTR